MCVEASEEAGVRAVCVKASEGAGVRAVCVYVISKASGQR